MFVSDNLHLQANGSERSLTTRRRAPERKSLRKRLALEPVIRLRTLRAHLCNEQKLMVIRNKF